MRFADICTLVRIPMIQRSLNVFHTFANIRSLPLKVFGEGIRLFVIATERVCSPGPLEIHPECHEKSVLRDIIVPKQQLTAFIKSKDKKLQEDQLGEGLNSSIGRYGPRVDIVPLGAIDGRVIDDLP